MFDNIRKVSFLQSRISNLLAGIERQAGIITFHKNKADKNSFIRFLLTNPSTSGINNYLQGITIQPYHVTFLHLSKAKLKKELEMY